MTDEEQEKLVDKLDRETKLKRLADKMEVTSEDAKRFGRMLKRLKDRQKDDVVDENGVVDEKGSARRGWFKKRREALRKKITEGKNEDFTKMYDDKKFPSIDVKELSKVIEESKRKRWFSRWRRKKMDFGGSGDFNIKGTETEDKPKRRGLFGRLREGFFSKERVKERHDFRVKVSGNRKWIMIGLAVVAICGTIIYLSVTYGGGGFSFVTKFLGVFK